MIYPSVKIYGSLFNEYNIIFQLQDRNFMLKSGIIYKQKIHDYWIALSSNGQIGNIRYKNIPTTK